MRRGGGERLWFRIVPWLVALPLAAQEPPRVVTRVPAHLAADVDAAATTRLEITFDRPMRTQGFSFCGGGPSFPEFESSPTWQDPRTIVVEVALEPDREYSLSLNCLAATNFRSQQGVALAPTPWSFTTLPEELPDPRRQRQRNEKALAELIAILDQSYAHRDLRVHDWPGLIAAAKPALLEAKTDRAWTAAAARMLQPTDDIHLSLRIGESVYPTGTRAVDPLFRRALVERELKLAPAGKQALHGRTDDGIGYLLIGAWTGDLDLDAVDRALGELRSCKAMVIDARPNSGGDERLAQHVAAWFVSGRKVYAKNRFRVQAGKDGFGPVQGRSLTGNADAARRFEGPIAVLTSRYVMSSNESFVMMLQQAQDCTVIGQPTFGSSGNPKLFELSNGATVVVPTWQDLRLDGTCIEGEGIAPDLLVEVTPADLERADPILRRALEVLRAKIAK
jgi:hypothetical protein